MSLAKRRKINPDSIFNHKPIIDRILAYIITSSDIINIGLINKRCQSVFKTKKQQLKLKKRVEIERNINKVQHNGYALEYIKEQTPELCMAAVTQTRLALRFVKEQTLELCMAAVSKNGYALKYVKEQTLEICMAAVKQNEFALDYVNSEFIRFFLKKCLLTNKKK